MRNIVRSLRFTEDVELRCQYLLPRAGRAKVDELLETVFHTLEHLANFPQSGPLREFDHPELADLRFIPLPRPFQTLLVFFHIDGDTLLVERLMHGYRDLPRRLLDPPDAED